MSEEELVSALENSIATILELHPSDISVLVDSETGFAMYTISSANAEDASELQESLQDNIIVDAFGSMLSNQLPVITNVSIDPMDGVYVDVQLIVDATNSLNVNGSMQDFENASTDEWIVEMESVFITSTPSALPTSMPYLKNTPSNTNITKQTIQLTKHQYFNSHALPYIIHT
jgi:hypothetical protein